MIAIFNGLCTIMQTFEYMHNWHHSSAAHPQSLASSIVAQNISLEIY